MIQGGSGSVTRSMIALVSVNNLAPALPAHNVARPKLRLVQGASSEAAVEGSSDTQRSDWSARIAAIAVNEDRTAFADLFAFFAPRVKAYLQRTGTGEAQAEEIAQETLLTVWRKARLFDPASASAATWVFTIARNLRIDSFRRELRGGAIRVDEVEAEFEVDGTLRADARMMNAEAEALVRKALKELPPDQLRVIEMSFFEERPHGDIALTLRIPLGTVKSRVRLAMKRLRGLLDELQ
jgi:RNA polymerase sigma-70 factor (ECF subfamily)